MTLKTLGLEFAETKSEKIYNDLYHRIKPGLKNYINQIVKDNQASDDLFSMTMAIVYNKIEQYKPEFHISTWIYRIAYHEAIMHLRRKKRAATTPFSVFDSYYDGDNSRASETLIFNNTRSALITESAEQDLDLGKAIEQINQLTDIILVEGLKTMQIPKIEIYRESISTERLYIRDPKIIGVMSDIDIKYDIPSFDFINFDKFAEFIIKQMKNEK